MEHETAKEILVEVFCARPGEAEEMMHSRLEEMFKEYSSEAFYVLLHNPARNYGRAPYEEHFLSASVFHGL